MRKEKQSIKILIVDDIDIDLDILETILINLGFLNVIRATGGMDALRFAIEYQPDLIISDIMMPDLDGGQLREKLRENPKTKEIPVIFASSIISKEEEKRHGGQLAGGELLIVKPFKPDQVSEAISLAFK